MSDLIEIIKIAGVEGSVVALGAGALWWLAPRLDRVVSSHCKLLARLRHDSRRQRELLAQTARLLRRGTRERRALAAAVLQATPDDRRAAAQAAWEGSLVRGSALTEGVKSPPRAT